MANDIRVCDKCKHVRMKSFLPKVQSLDPQAKIQIGCKSYCGPCARAAFIFINGRYVTGASEDEAVRKASAYVKKS